MENYAVQQRRSSDNFSGNQDSSRHAHQLMYPYAAYAQHQQSQAPQPQAQPQAPPSQHQHQQMQRRTSLSQNPWSMNGHAEAFPQFEHGMVSKNDGPHLQVTSTSHQHPISAQSYGNLLAHNPMLQPNMFDGPLLDHHAVAASSVADFDLSRLAGSWPSQKLGDMDFSNLDSDIPDLTTHLVSNDEDCPTIIDLRSYSTLDANQDNPDSRRQSESAYSVSTTGPVADLPNLEDMSSSDQVPYGSERDSWSDMPANPASSISPSESPRRGPDSVIRTNNRARASPSSHNMRTSPYTLESNRLKRWSTGAHMPSSSQPPSRPLSQIQERFPQFGGPFAQHHMQHFQPNSMGAYPMHTQNMMYPHTHQSPPLFSTPEQPYSLEVPRPVPSQGMFPLLHSNAHRHGGCSTHFADLSDPPDLYSSLSEEPCDPPESDMHPDDPDMVPHEQDLRFTGDLYTPRWVRGHGNKREGWCGLCKPGRWLVLKNSAFWYDKSFTHGVSAATGAAFHGPQETRRTEGNLDVWEGLCGSCGDWIALVSSKKKGTTWFRHAYKCHTHPKVKDGPKRRRETSHQIRARTISSASTSSIPYPMSKESSHDPMPRLERSSISEGRLQTLHPLDTGAHRASAPPTDEKPQYQPQELVGLGGVKSVLASMV